MTEPRLLKQLRSHHLRPSDHIQVPCQVLLPSAWLEASSMWCCPAWGCFQYTSSWVTCVFVHCLPHCYHGCSPSFNPAPNLAFTSHPANQCLPLCWVRETHRQGRDGFGPLGSKRLAHPYMEKSPHDTRLCITSGEENYCAFMCTNLCSSLRSSSSLSHSKKKYLFNFATCKAQFYNFFLPCGMWDLHSLTRD